MELIYQFIGYFRCKITYKKWKSYGLSWSKRWWNCGWCWWYEFYRL